VTIPPIKEAEARPPIELVGVTADSPFPPGSGADLFAALSTHVLLYPIPLVTSGMVTQTFSPFNEHLFSPPESFPPSLLESHHVRLVLTNAPDEGVDPPTDRAFYHTNVFTLPCAAGSPTPSWRFHCRFAHRDATNGNRMFVGLQSWSGTYPGGHGLSGPDPLAGAGEFVGILVRAGDTTYQFAHSDGSTLVVTDLGVAVAIWTTVEDDFSAVMPLQMFDLFLAGVSGVDGYVWKVVDVNAGVEVASGTVATNIPDASLAMFYRGVCAPQAADPDDLAHTQWKQGIELIPLESVYYQDFGFGPVGIDPRGGSSTPPESGPPAGSLPWHETFDEADFDALRTKYTDGGGRADFPPTTGDITVSSGKMDIVGNALPSHVAIGPNTLGTPAREFWMKIEFEIIGGTYDQSDDACFVSVWDGATSNLETDQSTFLVSNPTHVQGIGLWNGTVSVSALTAYPRALPAGTYTYIICSSEDDSTTQRSELWINAAAGDAADAVVTGAKTSALGYDLIVVGFDGAVSPGITVRVTDIDTRAGSRASDPFGIL
jgi:hypothetical protein